MVVPVKRLDRAKTRLRASLPERGASGLDTGRRLVTDREGQLDRLAATVRANLDLKPLLAACGLG